MEFLPARRHVSRLAHRDAGVVSGTSCVPEETPIAMSFNGASYAVMMATPADLEDFAVGFALNEGIISSPEEVRGLNIVAVEGGVDCQVELADDASDRLKTRRRRIAGPVGCGLCGIESIAEAVRPVPRQEGGDVRLSDADIAQSVRLLAAAQPLHRETSAVHAAGFYLPGSGVIAVREDIGRHNALDKLAGVLSLRHVDAAKGAIVITSRVSVEMVQKTAVAGAPVLIAVSAPTALAVSTAQHAGVTLVARVRGNDFDIYTHAHRISEGEKADVA
ncbi:MAG TPA: formate dehydrogenase accessory sulfurtransferase FdhD [Pararhizobium sp.]|nr:formate dehydrogenase accessory sulfurtransferase FdhD [Pararhizobium sp.]